MSEALWIVLGLVAGAVGAAAVVAWRRRGQVNLAQQLLTEAQQQKEQEVATLIEQLKTSFSALSREALSANATDFLKLASTKLDKQTSEGEQTLEAKKKLIDAQLQEMSTKLGTLNKMIQESERQRAESHGTLKGQLDKATQATNRLQESTAQLREALTNPQARGQWGERMAEDVLRLAGFIEGVNYVKQQRLSDGTVPDFTFLLPQDQRVHMDVKFPLANYLKMLETEDQHAQAGYKMQFLRDVRSRVKEVTSRGYIDPAHGTVDYVLVFIPNEQIYGFIHECDNALLDDAIRSKVVLCSPLTLYAILAVIRQAVANFRLEESSGQILRLLGDFKKQWDKYVESMDRMGSRLDAAMKEFDSLKTTRTRQLERQLDKIEDLRAAREGQSPPSMLPPPEP